MPENDNAERFVERLDAHRSPEQREKYQRYFKLGEGEYGEGDEFVGVRMGQVFALAKEFIEMPPEEIEKLLESPIHEVRAGGLSIMDKQARRKRTPRKPQEGVVRPLHAAHGQDQQLGPGRRGLPVRRRRLPVRQTARRPLRAGALGEHLGTPHRHRQHLLLHQAGRCGRHLPDRRDAARRRRRT